MDRTWKGESSICDKIADRDRSAHENLKQIRNGVILSEKNGMNTSEE